MSNPDLDELQTRHLAYRAELGRRGVLVVNGPFAEQTDESYRGMSIFACGSLAFPLAEVQVGERRAMPDE